MGTPEQAWERIRQLEQAGVQRIMLFVTMAIGVNARTAFSLFFPSIVDEFHWERGLTAGAFSFGFVVSVVAPSVAAASEADPVGAAGKQLRVGIGGDGHRDGDARGRDKIA